MRKQVSGWFTRRLACVAACLTLGACAMFALASDTKAQDTYQKPPEEIIKILNAPITPRASVGRARDIVLFYSPVLYPPIAELAQPFARLAGLRIELSTNGTHNAPRVNNLVLKNVADGTEVKVDVPPNFYFSPPTWSPDGYAIAFTHATDSGIELWLADARTGKAAAVPGVKLNAALSEADPTGESMPCHWMPEGKALLCQIISAGRGAVPKSSLVPAGPRVQESFGKAAPVPTFEDLLENEFDATLFDYYATSQLAVIDRHSGEVTNVGSPAIFLTADPAPDGMHVLVSRIHRPYSYVVPVEQFARDVEVWDLSGSVVYKVASLPVQDNVPIGGVPTGPREIDWHPNKPGTLVWAEAWMKAIRRSR